MEPTRRPAIPVGKVMLHFWDRGVARVQALGQHIQDQVIRTAHEVSDTLQVAPSAAAQVVSAKLDALDAHLTAAFMNGAGLTDISRLPNAHKLATEQTATGTLRVSVRSPLHEETPWAHAPNSFNPSVVLMQHWHQAATAFEKAQALRQAGRPLQARKEELVQVFDTALYLAPWFAGAFALGKLGDFIKSKLPFQNPINLTDRRAAWVAQINQRFMPPSWGGRAALPAPVKVNHVPDTFETLRTGSAIMGVASVAAQAPHHDLNVYLNTDIAHTLFNASVDAHNVSFVYGDLSGSLWLAPLNARPPLLSGLDNHSNPYVFRDKKSYGYADIPILGIELGAGWRLGSSDYAIGSRFVVRPANVQVPIALERSEKEGPRNNKLIWRVGASALHMGFYPTAFVGPTNYGIRETASMSQIRGLHTSNGTDIARKFENRNSSQEVLSINPAYGYGPIEAGKTPDYVFSPRRWLGWTGDQAQP